MSKLVAYLKASWVAHASEYTAGFVAFLACALAGAWYLDPPVKIGYTRATVHSISTRYGDKAPGIRMLVTLPDGQVRVLDSRAFNLDLKPGVQICVLETKGRIRGRRQWQEALPSRCLAEPQP